MFKYLTLSKEKNTLYYYRENYGICCSTFITDSLINTKIVCRNVKKPFFVYKSFDNTTHLIAVSDNNELLYMTLKNNVWQKYTISKLNPKIEIKKIMIGVSNSLPNLFYSANYSNELILVHCILGNNAMPETIDKLCNENFFVNNDFIYYSNQQEELCYRNFSDSKPDRFTKISKGIMPYFTTIKGNNYIISKYDDNILINNEIKISDRDLEFPILQYIDDSPALFWKCGDFIKHLPLKNDYQKKPIQYIGIKNPPDIFVLSDGSSLQYFYGIVRDNTVRFFPKLDLSKKEINSADYNDYFNKSSGIVKLNKMISNLKNDIELYKTEITKLRQVIEDINTEN